MKHLKHILVTLSVLLIVFMTVACSNKNIGIDCKVSITARRDKITVVADFIDSEKRVFNGVTPVVNLYKMENDKPSEQPIETKSMSIKTGTSFSENTTSNEVVFSSLEKEKTYAVKILVTVDKYEHVLYENKEVKTTLDGLDAEHAIAINTVEDFLAIKNDREGFFRLEKDLDFSNVIFPPMYYLSSTPFTGEFDGNNKTIKNITLNSDQKYTGLFGYNEGVIKNLNIDNLTITSSPFNEAHVGFIAGYSEGKIENCHITNSTLTFKSKVYSHTVPVNVGGIVGTLSGSQEYINLTNNSIKSSTINVNLVNNGSVGGAIGEVNAASSARHNQTIKENKIEVNLNVVQEVTAKLNSNIDVCVGGFAGQLAGNVEDTVVKANVTLSTKSYDKYHTVRDEENKEPKLHNYSVFLGGIAGRDVSNGSTYINNALFEGKLEVTSSLPYTAEKDKEKMINFNLYVAGLLGNNYDAYVKNLVAKVSGIKVTTTKENISGEHNVYFAKLMNFKKDKTNAYLETNNIQLYADFTPEIVQNTLVLKTSELNHINNNLDKFSDFIKNSLK